MNFGDLHRGLSVEIDGAPYRVEEYSQQKMQQRAPTYTIRLRNILTGQLVERKFSGYGMELRRAEVETREANFLYEDGEAFHFMDSETFDQYEVGASVVGGEAKFLVDQAAVQLIFYKGAPVSVEMPTTADLEVAETPPAHRGDTQSGGTKPATTVTGLVVTVPLFINAGDVVRVDTRTGAYVTRVT
ncbi:MAG: elongation factor P [Chloroflexota bacterium]|nr:elongation factor P [Chloroflexota bacterium]